MSYNKCLSITLPGEGVVVQLNQRFVALHLEIEQSKYMLEYPDNWDDEGSLPYKKSTWKRAVQFIANYAEWIYATNYQVILCPKILHGPTGSIDIYWRNEDFHLLINISIDEKLPATFYGDDYHGQTVEGKLYPAHFRNIFFKEPGSLPKTELFLSRS